VESHIYTPEFPPKNWGFDVSRKIIDVNFGSRSRRNKRKIIDHLEKLIEYIKGERLLFQPHGYLLILMSEDNPDHYELLNVGITKFEMGDCRLAIIKHVAEMATNSNKDKQGV
jgi:hypothetical protein